MCRLQHKNGDQRNGLVAVLPSESISGTSAGSNKRLVTLTAQLRSVSRSGTDWPQVMLPGTMPNDAELVELLARRLSMPELREQALVRNPVALYDFGSPA